MQIRSASLVYLAQSTLHLTPLVYLAHLVISSATLVNSLCVI